MFTHQSSWPAFDHVAGAKEWRAQVVRTSVANPEGWAIWDNLVGNE
jgi:hypothetical protein